MAMTAQQFRPPANANHDALHRTGIALRGVVAIALGGLFLYYRAYSTVLVVAFVAFAIIDGLARVVIALRSTGRDRAWLIHALEGAFGIALGVAAWQVARDLISLTWTIADWAIGLGVLGIIFGAVTFGRLKDAWLWVLGGVLLIVLGALLLWFTFGGLLAPGIALGLFGIVYGVLSLIIAARA